MNKTVVVGTAVVVIVAAAGGEHMSLRIRQNDSLHLI